MVANPRNIIHKALTQTSPRALGSVLLNILGIQFFRVLFFEIAYRVRSLLWSAQTEHDDLINRLKSDGIVTIPNFFSNEDFIQIKDYCQSTTPDEVLGTNPVRSIKTFSKHLSCNSALIEKKFINNTFLNTVISKVSAHTMRATPRTAFYKDEVDKYGVGKPQCDTQDIAHYDVPYHTFKAALYIEDCFEDNGAFMFAPGSHKITLKRLLFETLYAIKYSRFRKKNSRSLLKLTKAEKKFLGLNIQSMGGKANTLIIFNANGFHRRGDFKKPSNRQVLFVDYRSLDSLLNKACTVRACKNKLQKTYDRSFLAAN